jgi:bifunctional DNA-binding transcriptional regulator/antitoxin component of YhaV-PrlF toxin-antitoxin module
MAQQLASDHQGLQRVATVVLATIHGVGRRVAAEGVWHNIYAIGTVDASGRVRDQSILEAMGWEAGQTLTITASAGAVIIRRDPRGVFTVATLHLTIPGPLRTRYYLHGGDRVLLVARAYDTTLIHTMALLHQSLPERHVLLLDGGGAQ